MSLLEMNGIVKRYGGIHALKGVDLTLNEGEILCLVGENGAGKSTLMKILSGAITKDEGSIRIGGEERNITSPQDSIAFGISVIYQELNMAKELSVAENVFLGHYPLKNRRINWKYMNEQTTELFKQLEAQCDPKEKVKNLSIAQQQLIEIAKAVKNQSKIIVFDEPSAVLGQSDSEALFALIRRLKAQGTGIIYISHRLDEVMDLADRIMVLRDGAMVTTEPKENFTMARMITEMTGRSMEDMWARSETAPSGGEPTLVIKGLTYEKNRIKDVNFAAYPGEVLGLAGLVGSGRTEIVRCLFGADIPDHMEMILHGKPVTIRSPQEAIRHGIAFVTEDRKNQGLLLDRPIGENITLTALGQFARKIRIDRRAEQKRIDELKEKLAIKTEDTRNPVKSLSGGNQQKVVLAKWLHTEPDILILDEPTRGVDVGAKTEIYKIIDDLRRQGKTILLISSEFQEIMTLSTRICVVKNGTIVRTMTREEAEGDAGLLATLS